MFCGNCGKELRDDNAFCTNCGAKINTNNGPSEPLQAEPVYSDSMGYEPVPQKKTIDKNKKTKIIIASAISAATLLVIAAVIVFMMTRGSAKPETISDDKAAVLMDDIYNALDIQDFEEAGKILGKIRLVKDSAYETEFDELKRLVGLAPVVEDVDTSDYPNVTIELSCSGKTDGFDKSSFSIEENSENFKITNVDSDKKKLSITYTANPATEEKTQKSVLNFECFDTIDYSIPFKYKTEPMSDAYISFVTSNVTDYPEVSAYFRVEDEFEQPIENLKTKAFKIYERLDINDYMEREILSVKKLDGIAALNVSLVIDKSASISDSSMNKIKNVTNSFLSKLQFDSGDKAGVISFDSYVLEMCAFTNNQDYLTNGVNSMYPYGNTACYDAIIKGINNAANQSGARCVIAFTDGEDNESFYTANNVISTANQKSVPVYIIGVGSDVDEYVLRNIATSTGGTYHHIDDVSDMSGVYDEIFREQKSMYCVTYKSSDDIAVNQSRNIRLDVAGNGYAGSCSKDFVPVIPVTKVKHDSRYEVIPADVSWEEANNLCNQKGGHLATITSQAEADTVIALVEQSGKERVWLGGYTTNSRNLDSVGHWITGEPWTFDMWMEGEPSRFDKGKAGDGEPEFYLMLWKINGVWSWNDQRNDLINSEYVNTYKGNMAYVIEYEE